MGFKEQAIAAHYKSNQEIENREQEQREKETREVRAQFFETFGLESDNVSGTLVAIDGIELVRKTDTLSHFSWRVYTFCQSCSERVLSDASVKNLAGVGQLLEDGDPYAHGYGSCKKDMSEPSLPEQLADLIRQIAQEQYA